MSRFSTAHDFLLASYTNYDPILYCFPPGT